MPTAPRAVTLPGGSTFASDTPFGGADLSIVKTCWPIQTLRSPGSRARLRLGRAAEHEHGRGRVVAFGFSLATARGSMRRTRALRSALPFGKNFAVVSALARG